MHVVLDTNVFVSGLFFGGTPRAVLDLVESKAVIPCFIPFTFRELQEVLLRDKFDAQRSLLPFSVEEFLSVLESYCLFFAEPVMLLNIIKEDPADNNFLACALISRASFLVSGDRHLLNLKQFHDIPIVTSTQFLKQFKQKS